MQKNLNLQKSRRCKFSALSRQSIVYSVLFYIIRLMAEIRASAKFFIAAATSHANIIISAGEGEREMGRGRRVRSRGDVCDACVKSVYTSRDVITRSVNRGRQQLLRVLKNIRRLDSLSFSLCVGCALARRRRRIARAFIHEKRASCLAPPEKERNKKCRHLDDTFARTRDARSGRPHFRLWARMSHNI